MYMTMHTHQNISSGECWWNFTSLQVQLHWMLNNIQESSHMFTNIENSLEHWITFTYILILRLETKAAVCIIHHKEYFKLPTFFIKFLLKYSCF